VNELRPRQHKVRSRASSRTIHTHLLEHGAVDYLIHLSKQRCDLSESIGYLKFFSASFDGLKHGR
jgi:hypothetical protein